LSFKQFHGFIFFLLFLFHFLDLAVFPELDLPLSSLLIRTLLGPLVLLKISKHVDRLCSLFYPFCPFNAAFKILLLGKSLDVPLQLQQIWARFLDRSERALILLKPKLVVKFIYNSFSSSLFIILLFDSELITILSSVLFCISLGQIVEALRNRGQHLHVIHCLFLALRGSDDLSEQVLLVLFAYVR